MIKSLPISRGLAGLLLGVLFLLPQRAEAQWRVGASCGANYDWYSVNTQYQADYRYEGVWGWSAAVFGQYNFMEWLGLRAEVEATDRNYRFYRTGVYEGTNYVVHNTYLQVPVMAQFSFGSSLSEKGNSVRGFVNVGVYAGCWLAGKYKGNLYDYLNFETNPVDEPYIFQSKKDQRADFGLAGGLGVEYRFLQHWAVHVEGRCYYSLISTVKQYMLVRDYRYHTTLGINAGFAYIF